MRYESERDVDLRLKNSVVMAGGRPVLVMGARSVREVLVTDILSGDSSDVKVSELDLSPSSAKLGYVIKDRGLLMTMRKPVRKYKQGLTTENLLSFNALERPTDDQMCGRLPPMVRAHDTAIARCILGDYPDIGDAFKAVREGTRIAVPFERNWAVGMVQDELALLYRGQLAGFATDTSVRLLPECFFLKESLEAALGE